MLEPEVVVPALAAAVLGAFDGGVGDAPVAGVGLVGGVGARAEGVVAGDFVAGLRAQQRARCHQVAAPALGGLCASVLKHEDAPGANHPHVVNGYWEPHHVYLLHFARDGMYKVGISRVGANRVEELTERGVTVVDRIELANQWATKILEFTVLELSGEAWVRVHRFSTGRKGETEHWLDWLKPPALVDLVGALDERQLPCLDVSAYRLA